VSGRVPLPLRMGRPARCSSALQVVFHPLSAPVGRVVFAMAWAASSVQAGLGPRIGEGLRSSCVLRVQSEGLQRVGSAMVQLDDDRVSRPVTTTV
jgi:hypothetical protein